MRPHNATLGNYTLGALLGRGGTSEVYAAEHRFLGDAVAVKLLRPGLAQDEAVRASFLAEAARTREIQHPGIVQVLDFGHDETTGSCYLVMERIEGASLAALLRGVTRLAEPELRQLGAELAEAMHAAHERGIVHRDLKPGNVMLRGAHPTIIDFGIAKSLGAGSAVVTDRRVGTLAYMAPEQLADGLITRAVDIWALGVILYEAATGRPPFEGFNDGRLPQLVDQPMRAAALATLSPAVDDLIARCLERDPSKRPVSMAVIARVLRGEEEERITEDAGARPIVRKRSVLPIVLGAAAAIAASIALVLALDRETPAASTTPPVVEHVQEVSAPQPAVEQAPPSQPAVEPAEPGATTPRPKPQPKRKPAPRTPVTSPPRTTQGETLD